MLTARFWPFSMAWYCTVTAVPSRTWPLTWVFLSTTKSILLLFSLTSRLKECPPFPIEAIFPETVLAAGCSCLPPGSWALAVRTAMPAPKVSNPASEAPTNSFRIMIPHLLVCGRVEVLRHVRFPFRIKDTVSQEICGKRSFLRGNFHNRTIPQIVGSRKLFGSARFFADAADFFLR